MPAVRHEHCEHCYAIRCPAPSWLSLGCAVVRCPNDCGSSLHACKEDEHRLLCPNETVPCLNAGYGCPLSMPRHRRARHLEACPASVVGCSQEWNRWPVPDNDLTFYRNVSRESQRQLDVALALRDQELLFKSIKMKRVFPELTDPEDIDVGVTREDLCSASAGDTPNVCAKMMEEEPSDELDRESLQKYSSWERIFKKEMNGEQTSKNAAKTEESGKKTEAVRESSSCENRTSGLAPWQDGVLEKLGKEANIGEYNMYLVHNGAMLINFGQLAACTPREKDFVYGSLEPIEVKSVRSFNVPSSYRAKRWHLKDPNRKIEVAHRSADTADLDVSFEELPKCEEVSVTLLCCLEKEFKGHQISESTGLDGLYVNVGTQTYNLDGAPFQAEASLADAVAGKAACLHVRTQTESVTRRHNRTSSVFSYTCGLFFRRDEYPSHFRNVHSEIQAGLGGWFLQRCPLAYLGCTFAQTRFRPDGQPAEVKYHRGVDKLVIRPDVPRELLEGTKASNPPDRLSHLPAEILRHVARYLDSFALSQLSQVSRPMREVCGTLLQSRGMVSLKWEKKTYSHGGSSWKSRKKVWEFSSLFCPVERWHLSDSPSVAVHLRTCPYYQTERRTEPVALSGLLEVCTEEDH
ncbi:F-box only protein 40-like [Syngnathus typhle]|uniref:F-box only protein 40-like n=1 Tax=Syngnathus typhle TaxID=161592 RepID=UPI002A6A8AA3|nr:F-box only protein 40-like [Syngnathus typhle]XP_061137843.1 F-box only protein 40-like [Syngnathus typhle]